MYVLHPYEHIYFNKIIGNNLREIKYKYELDYWGLSYVEGIKYILNNTEKENVNLFAETGYPIEMALRYVDSKSLKKINVVDDTLKADYLLAHYHKINKDYDYKNEVFNVKRENTKIFSVFQLR